MSCVCAYDDISHLCAYVFWRLCVINSNFSLYIIFKCTVAMNYNILKTEEQSWKFHR